MNSASEYVKTGGLLGFSVVFITVLLTSKDISGALLDASIACVIMAFLFQMLFQQAASMAQKNRKLKHAAEPVEEHEPDLSTETLPDHEEDS